MGRMAVWGTAPVPVSASACQRREHLNVKINAHAADDEGRVRAASLVGARRTWRAGGCWTRGAATTCAFARTPCTCSAARRTCPPRCSSWRWRARRCSSSARTSSRTCVSFLVKPLARAPKRATRQGCATSLARFSCGRLRCAQVEERTGWELVEHVVRERVHARLFRSTTLLAADELSLRLSLPGTAGS